MEGGIWSRLRSPTAVRGLSAIVEQGIYSVTSFLAGVLVARSTSQEECGVYILAMTTLVFAQGMQASLFGTPFTVLSLRLEPRERMACLGHGFLQATMFALLVMSVVLAGSWAVVRFSASEWEFCTEQGALLGMRPGEYVRIIVRDRRSQMQRELPSAEEERHPDAPEGEGNA